MTILALIYCHRCDWEMGVNQWLALILFGQLDLLAFRLATGAV